MLGIIPKPVLLYEIDVGRFTKKYVQESIILRRDLINNATLSSDWINLKRIILIIDFYQYLSYDILVEFYTRLYFMPFVFFFVRTHTSRYTLFSTMSTFASHHSLLFFVHVLDTLPEFYNFSPWYWFFCILIDLFIAIIPTVKVNVS